MDNTNALNWFEIPVTDIDRAKAFYAQSFGVDMGETIDMMGMKMAFFPAADGKVSGGLAQSDMHKPSSDGSIIYLNANPSMETILENVASAGGTVVMPKTKISDEIGYMAFFMDTEGNKLGLHANN